MILFGSEPMNCRFVCMSDDKISLSTSLLSQLFTGDKPWTGTFFSEIFINFDINFQIANTCDWFGHIDSPQNAIFGCVLALCFCLLVLGHPVW